MLETRLWAHETMTCATCGKPLLTFLYLVIEQYWPYKKPGIIRFQHEAPVSMYWKASKPNYDKLERAYCSAKCSIEDYKHET